MQAQLSLDLDPDRPPPYRQRGTNVLQTIFKEHFQHFAEDYERKYAPSYARFRLERITEVVENFISCSDYTQGVAGGVATRARTGRTASPHTVQQP